MKFRKIIPLILCAAMLFTTGCSLGGGKKASTTSAGGFCSMKEKLESVKNADEAYKIVQAALDEGKSLDLAGIEIEISKPLILYNQDIYGGKITYTGNDGQPVIKMAGKCVIDNVGIANTCENNNCGEGKYVGIWLSNDKGTVTNGSAIRSVKFSACGTLVYAPKDVESAANGLVIENLRAEGWWFRGIDFQSKNCTNNSFYNLYINRNDFAGTRADKIDDLPVSDSAFYLNGSVSPTIKQLNVEHTNIRQPIIFKDCKDLDVSTIHIEGVNTAEDGRGYVNISNTDGKIGAIDFYWSHVYAKNNALVKLEDSGKDGNEIVFETFLIKGINDPATHVEGIKRGMDNCGIKIFARDDEFTNPYYVTIENYVYFTFQNDKDLLEDFYSDKDNITFKKIGQLPAGGTTEERPTKRLCAGYTEYFDTTVGKLLVFNGTSWE